MAPEQSLLDRHLGASRDRYLRFVRGKISDPELAEDVLHDAMFSALRSEPELDDEERLSAWFYRVLRNAVIDAYRRRDVRGRHHESLPEGFEAADPEPGDTAAICECFQEILPLLKPEYAEVIEALDLRDEAPGEFAVRVGIAPHNVKVRRHRARRALKKRLEETCRLCAPHGCLDCTCGEGVTA